MRFLCSSLKVDLAIGRHSSQLYRNYCPLAVVFVQVLLGIHLVYCTNQYLRCVGRSKIAKGIKVDSVVGTNDRYFIQSRGEITFLLTDLASRTHNNTSIAITTSLKVKELVKISFKAI